MMTSSKTEGTGASMTATIKDVFAGERVKDILQVRLATIFIGSPADELTQNSKEEARKRATEIIQREIPQYITHLNGLIDGANNDKNSPLWQGHLTQGPFVKEHVKLVFDNDRGAESDGQPQGAPTILFRNVDELSLKELPSTDVEVGVTGPQWRGRLTSNIACDRLMDLLEA
jgi:hypothetical protein